MDGTKQIHQARLHAVIPAAGRSTRMGSSKLLLPWRGTTVIESLLSLLLDADLAAVAVAVRADDRELRAVLDSFRGLLSAERRSRLHIVVADLPPAAMRNSVELLLNSLHRLESPAVSDAWMLIPADAVAVQPATIEQLCEAWRRDPRGVLIPTYDGERGHPTLFAWELVQELAKIPPDRGVNWLLHQPDVSIHELALADRGVLCDLDTPQDYATWSQSCD